MIFQALDKKQDLFSVQEALPREIYKELSKIPLETVPYTKMEWQELTGRRKLMQLPGSIFETIHTHINNHRADISTLLGKSVSRIDTAFWYDTEGFDFVTHIDNPGVKDVMQLYLNNCAEAGTTFYDVPESEIEEKDDAQFWHYKGTQPPEKIRHRFDFKQNTGYIMRNHKQQVHGVPGKVLKGEHRLSIYCWIS